MRAKKTSAHATDRSAGRSRASTIIVTGVLTIIALYFLIPIYGVVVAATKTSEDLFTTFGFWFAPNFALWDNLGQVLTYDNGIFVRWFMNSVLYAGVGAVLATYFAAAGGYALGKYKFRGNSLIFGLILGASLCRPMARPVAYAPVSTAKTGSRASRNHSRPSPRSRMSTSDATPIPM